MSEHARVDWAAELADQLDYHWRHGFRAKLDGLGDAEYFWEPTGPDTGWSVRPRGRSQAQIQAGAGDYVIEFGYPEPVPAPVTSIAWRLGHLIVGVLGQRTHDHFGGPQSSYDTWEFASTGAEAVQQLDRAYDRWTSAVRGLDATALAEPVGAAEGPFAQSPMATLVLHINREVLHHGAEILLLRDLYRAGH